MVLNEAQKNSSTFSKKEQRAIQILIITMSFENNYYSVKTLAEEQPTVTNQQPNLSSHSCTR